MTIEVANPSTCDHTRGSKPKGRRKVFDVVGRQIERALGRAVTWTLHQLVGGDIEVAHRGVDGLVVDVLVELLDFGIGEPIRMPRLFDELVDEVGVVRRDDEIGADFQSVCHAGAREPHREVPAFLQGEIAKVEDDLVAEVPRGSRYDPVQALR